VVGTIIWQKRFVLLVSDSEFSLNVGSLVYLVHHNPVDERVLSWPLMETPYATIAICVAYVAIVWLLLGAMK
jgi:hypothetical protein